MEGNVIKSFLVGLGFSIDDSSFSKFTKSIATATLKVTALYAGIQAAAGGIFKAITGIASGFEDMGYQLRLVAPAVNKMLILREAMLDAYRKAGINLTQVVKQSILFNYSLAKTKFALEAVYKSVGAKFLPLLTKQMDIFRKKIFDNMPKIQAFLTKFIDIIFKAFDATVELGTRLWSILGRVWDFLKELDEATNGWSTKIIALIAIWKAFNLAFLATPLGLVLAGLVAILALYDDFKVWEEGGKSFFNWGPLVPIFHEVASAIKSVGGFLAETMRTAWDFMDLIIKLFSLDPSGFGKAWARMAGDIERALGHVIDYFKAYMSFFQSAVSIVSNAAGSVANLLGIESAQNIAGVNQPAPLLPGGANKNLKVNQETNIFVQGSPDAHGTAKEVAHQQDRVNFDMTRNMGGAVK